MKKNWRGEVVAFVDGLASHTFTGKRSYTRAIKDLEFERMLSRFPWKL